MVNNSGQNDAIKKSVKCQYSVIVCDYVDCYSFLMNNGKENKKMSKENTSLRLETDTLEKIRIYAEIEKKSQSDFINELLDSALNDYFLKRAGGMTLTVPNPQFFHIDKNKAIECIDQITKTAGLCTHANIHTGMLAVANFMETRIFTDTADRKEYFKANLSFDK